MLLPGTLTIYAFGVAWLTRVAPNATNNGAPSMARGAAVTRLEVRDPVSDPSEAGSLPSTGTSTGLCTSIDADHLLSVVTRR
jgi:hypothetical protein